MEIKKSKQPKLDTLSDRRKYLSTQFKAGVTMHIDTYDVPEYRLSSFVVRVKETYGSKLLSIRFSPHPSSKVDYVAFIKYLK